MPHAPCLILTNDRLFSPTYLVICPGIHQPSLTQSFVSSWLESLPDSTTRSLSEKILIFQGEGLFVLSGLHILQFLYQRLGGWNNRPVLFISFSAGVVGAIAAAHMWQWFGGQVIAFIAIDGWGVPLSGKFPIHRMSHDYFTHWSSSLLDTKQMQRNFYADPSVEHLEMWRSPQNVQGWSTDLDSQRLDNKLRLTAAEFLHILIKRYGVN
jgi:hypothetical protein